MWTDKNSINPTKEPVKSNSVIPSKLVKKNAEAENSFTSQRKSVATSEKIVVTLPAKASASAKLYPIDVGISVSKISKPA